MKGDGIARDGIAREVAVRDDVERELRRVTDRLGTMPLQRLSTTTGDVYACAAALVAAGRELGVPIPADAAVPDLRPQAYADLIAVLGRDCLDAGSSDAGALHEMLDALVGLRRALP